MNLFAVRYSDKSVAIFGQTLFHKDVLKQLGGKFCQAIAYNGIKRPAWVYSKKNKNLDEFVLKNEIPVSDVDYLKEDLEEVLNLRGSFCLIFSLRRYLIIKK
jgi:hypothetical protein